ncbi:MAG: peptidoglycan bridge formation glycyltransferase FemA/FemB family protein [Clostridia bacterium]|nr:peptidoglycan bridge formation glycyltransferase FemA/FemB family protein [Clostridia bacterium]
MPVLDKNNEIQVKRYNEFVRNYPGASIMQDLNWGIVKSGWKQEAVYIEEKGKIIAAMTILLEKVPFIKSYLMYATRGPVCDLANIELVNKLVKEADIIAKKYNAFLFKFDPEVVVSEEIESIYKNNGYKVLGKNVDKDDLIQPLHNAVLNIKDKSEDELLKGFGEKTRYNIKVAQKKEIKVSYSHNEEYLKIFYEIYKITTVRDKIGCRAYSYFENLLNAFDEKTLRIYIAEHENDKLSAAIALNYGGKLFYVYGASSNEKRNLMPNYLMQWEMIKWGIETKCTNYDFGGVLVLDKDDGLYKFKIGFCKQEGITEYIGEIDKVYNKAVYFAYAKLLPFIKKIKRKIRKMKAN